MEKLKDKVAVITGGTSGMGLATAKLYAREGAHVFITGRSKEDLDKAVQAIGKNVTGVKCDSTVLSDLDHLYEKIETEKGRLDIVFANAGMAVAAPFDKVTEEEFDQQFDLNVKGTFFTVQKSLRLLSRNASIILTGSLAALKAIPALSVYSGSKGALEAFIRCWAGDLKDRGIRVNMIVPGSIDTPSLQKNSEEQKAIFRSHIPLGRFGKPEEIATTALFLASEDAGFINGMSILVDGGAHI